jgi:hypothetical protein
VEPSDEQGFYVLIGGSRMLATQLLTLDRLARGAQVERETKVFGGEVGGIIRH